MNSLGQTLSHTLTNDMQIKWFRASLPHLPSSNLHLGFVPLLDWHTQRSQMQNSMVTSLQRVVWLTCDKFSYCVAVIIMADSQIVPIATILCAPNKCPGPQLEC